MRGVFRPVERQRILEVLESAKQSPVGSQIEPHGFLLPPCSYDELRRGGSHTSIVPFLCKSLKMCVLPLYVDFFALLAPELKL